MGLPPLRANEALLPPPHPRTIAWLGTVGLTLAEAPILAALTGSCYWAGWAVMGGAPALLCTGVFFPIVPVKALAGSTKEVEHRT